MHMNTKMLLSMAATIILAVAVACSGNEPQPTNEPGRNEPGRNEQGPSQTIEAMTQELAALKTETAGSQSNPDGPRPTARIQPTSARSTPTSEPTTPPTAIVIAPPTGPGICGRTPEVQGALLTALGLHQCSVVTGPELLRIRDLGVGGSLKTGDLSGLHNLKTLSVSLEGAEPAAGLLEDLRSLETLNIWVSHTHPPHKLLKGLTSLESLDLKVSGEGAWNLQGMLNDTGNLRILHINSEGSLPMGPGSYSPVHVQEGDLAGLHSLENLVIGVVASLDSNVFEGLDSLRYVKLRGASSYGEPVSDYPTFPASLLKDSPSVESWSVDLFQPVEEMPLATLEQLCRINSGSSSSFWHGKITEGTARGIQYYVDGEKVSVISKNQGTCRVGIGEPGPNEGFPESQVKIIDGGTGLK